MKISLTLKLTSVLVVFVLGFVTGCSVLRQAAKNAKIGASDKTKPQYAEFLDPDSPKEQLTKRSQDLLVSANFGELEAMADAARTNKERLPGGYWNLDAIYDGLSNIYADRLAQPITEEDWKNRIKVLAQWTEVSPNSQTPKVALAAAYIQYGWFARGFGYANTVSSSDSKLLQERLDMADKVLREAHQQGVRCPRLYREVLFLAMAQGWPMDDIVSIYSEFLSVEPTYLQAHLVMSELLTPKWGGQDGEWRTFIDSIPEAISASGSDEADLIYFVVVANKIREPSLKINWGNIAKDRVKNGFAQLEEKYGVDNFRLNQYAYLASLTMDYPSAHSAFTRIGPKLDIEVWDRSTFEMFKKMAEPGAQQPNRGYVLEQKF